MINITITYASLYPVLKYDCTLALLLKNTTYINHVPL